jgi:hypothetical protein
MRNGFHGDGGDHDEWREHGEPRPKRVQDHHSIPYKGCFGLTRGISSYHHGIAFFECCPSAGKANISPHANIDSSSRPREDIEAPIQ